MCVEMRRNKRIILKNNRTHEVPVFVKIGYKIRFIKSSYKTPFKLKKQFWYDEYSDTDMFTPSCPHLHSLDGKYKLNVYTGEFYDIRNKRIIRDKYVPEDELKKLWKDPEFCSFAKTMRKIYNEKYPNSQLPEKPFQEA